MINDEVKRCIETSIERQRKECKGYAMSKVLDDVSAEYGEPAAFAARSYMLKEYYGIEDEDKHVRRLEKERKEAHLKYLLFDKNADEPINLEELN